MNLHRFGLKIFLEETSALTLTDVIPVFHRWIQTSALPGLWIDVADYSHVPGGPGILLIGHEANLSVDVGADGRVGLLYLRKASTEGRAPEALDDGLSILLAAVRLLEGDGDLGLGLRFRFDEILFFANDRLRAHSGGRAFADLVERLRPILEIAYGGGVDVVSEEEKDPRERVAIRARPRSGVDPRALRGRLAA